MSVPEASTYLAADFDAWTLKVAQLRCVGARPLPFHPSELGTIPRPVGRFPPLANARLTPTP
jgi:hypothetical protein